jgi:hypothetical protein
MARNELALGVKGRTRFRSRSLGSLCRERLVRAPFEASHSQLIVNDNERTLTESLKRLRFFFPLAFLVALNDDPTSMFAPNFNFPDSLNPAVNTARVRFEPIVGVYVFASRLS